MSGTRGGFGRILVLGVALALALLLLVAKEASAGKYAVAQCGWYVGADASWADTTSGAKFRPDAWCVPPAGQDPFDGAHLKSFTREGQSTVTGTRFARWRWEAPAGTGITQVRGTWWHALHDGIEQRLGVAAGGGFDVFASASATDTTPREFVAGFSTPRSAFEDRLLCARAESKWCSLESGSWSALRALTITVEDDNPPASSVEGDMLAGGWLRGDHKLGYRATDVGAGLKRTEALIDGNPVLGHDHPCNAASIAGESRATTMQPCPTERVGYYPLSTLAYSDGSHTVGHCATDFAGNVSCLPPRQILIDNNPPAHPRNLSLAGGDGWRRTDDFDVSWENPDQGRASPIAGASWRIAGPAGFDTGVTFVAGRGLSALQNLAVPHAGVYTLSVWLRDEAGNEAPASAVSLPLRFDDVPPGVAFDPPTGDGLPQAVVASIADTHSGPAGGEVHFRPIGDDSWAELPSKLERSEADDSARLVARLPQDLAPGTYLFRADAADGAGNTASTTRRADGVEMTVRAPRPDAQSSHDRRSGAKTRIFARLVWRGRSGTDLTVPFGAGAMLSGRLVDADGAGLGRRRLRVVSRSSRGALRRRRIDSLRTGSHGGFSLALPPGTSRRIAVSFAGEEQLDGARRAPLTLRVRGGLDLRVSPRALRTGETVHFSGRVRGLGAPLPRRGKLVAIQYYEQAAGEWRPVLLTRSDHSGRFHARYRFRYVTGSASVQLRAVALAEERWPYAPGFSRAVTVRVTG